MNRNSVLALPRWRHRFAGGGGSLAGVPPGLVVGTVVVVVALVSIPLIVGLSGVAPGPAAHPVVDVLPDRASGAYLDVTTQAIDGYVALFSWTAPPAEQPDGTPVLAPGTIGSIILAQKGLDVPERYRLFRLADRTPVAVDAMETVPGRRMSLEPVAPLRPGAYLLDVPIGGMFAGREYFVFAVGEEPSRLVPAAAVTGGITTGAWSSWISWVLVALAGLAASLFSLDLGRNYARSRKPHTLGYALGMAMFALATWSLLLALTIGWNAATFRSFYLFGAVLNVPFLATGSVYLVLGRRAGRIVAALVVGFAAVATFVTVGAPMSGPMPSSGIPAGSELFSFPGPRIWAALGGGLGATTIFVLAVVSLFRFRRRSPALVRANLLIAGGVLAAASGGTGLALGAESGFALSLLAAASMIWLGHRTASGSRPRATPAAASSP